LLLTKTPRARQRLFDSRLRFYLEEQAFSTPLPITARLVFSAEASGAVAALDEVAVLGSAWAWE